MAVFKCKMCGANLEISEGLSVVTCEYCNTQQTLPKFDNERKITLFNRANHLRFNCEFDKASGIYESIIAEFSDEAEAYWGLVLCKYGIEYVDDKDGKKIPTCHRTVPTSIMDDEDFNLACDYADLTSKTVYRNEAKVIDSIQKKILEIASTEKPYDIFICYKETDDSTGARTEDSSIAQDIYTQLIKNGYKVFYARDSLKSVAGTDYEPYIYAALSSAKVMLAIGTKYEYYDAVWVKNEWSRFISMMADNTSKVLIPCFKNMDAYDMPKEFTHMQALDMSDVTFFGSLTDNIRRVLPKTKLGISTGASANVDSLLKRAFMFLEDGDWNNANAYCEKVLDSDPENAQAYLGKLLVEYKCHKLEDLEKIEKTFVNSVNYQKVVRFGDAQLKTTLENYLKSIDAAIGLKKINGVYQQAVATMSSAETIERYQEAIKEFKRILKYKDSAKRIEQCEGAIEKIKYEQEQKRLEIERKRKEALEERVKNKKELREKIDNAIPTITVVGAILFLIIMLFAINSLFESKYSTKDVSEEIVEVESTTKQPKKNKKPVLESTTRKNYHTVENTNAFQKDNYTKENTEETDYYSEIPRGTVFFAHFDGISYEDAVKKLEENGYTYYVTYVYSSSYKKGTIVGEAGEGWYESEFALPGDTIELLVSAGSVEDAWHSSEPGSLDDKVVKEIYVYDAIRCDVLCNPIEVLKENASWEELYEECLKDVDSEMKESYISDDSFYMTYHTDVLRIDRHLANNVWRYDYEIWD